MLWQHSLNISGGGLETGVKVFIIYSRSFLLLGLLLAFSLPSTFYFFFQLDVSCSLQILIIALSNWGKMLLVLLIDSWMFPCHNSSDKLRRLPAPERSKQQFVILEARCFVDTSFSDLLQSEGNSGI